MLDFFNHLIFALGVTGPIFFLLLLGIGLRRIDWIDQEFMDAGSRLVFKLTLPVLIFMSVSKADLAHFDGGGLILYVVLSNIFVYLLLMGIGRLTIEDAIDRRMFIHGGYRANAAIIGLSYVNNAFGQDGLAIGAILVSFIIILYNILAVILLTPKESSANRVETFTRFAKGIATNPLIIASVCGIIFSQLDLSLPQPLEKTGKLVAGMTLPLALICTGGTLNFNQLKKKSSLTWASTGAKLILAPIVITFGAYLLGFSSLEVGVIFLLSSSPTAVVSYIMAKTMGGNAILAANIIATTSLGSVITSSLGLTILSSCGVI